MNRKDQVNEIYKQLLDNLMSDLGDSSKCGPGLYQVVRGVMQDNRELLDQIPEESIDAMARKLESSMPFKFKSTQAG